MRGTPLVWRAAPHEAGEVARLIGLFRDHLDHGGPGEEEILRSVRRLLDDPAAEFLLGALEDRAAPCGVAQLRFRHSLWTASDDCWLEDLFVDAAVRGRGLGRALVLASCERARERGCARIELDTNEGNAPAIALYESVGFSSTSKSHGAGARRDLFLGRRL